MPSFYRNERARSCPYGTVSAKLVFLVRVGKESDEGTITLLPKARYCAVHEKTSLTTQKSSLVET